MNKKKIWEKLNNLSEKQLDSLAEAMGVGINDSTNGSPIDRDEKILVLSTEPVEKILKGLKKIKVY